MKRFLALLSVLGWLLIVYWGLPPSLLSVPGSLFSRFVPDWMMDAERSGGRQAPRFAKEPLKQETVVVLSRNSCPSSEAVAAR